MKENHQHNLQHLYSTNNGPTAVLPNNTRIRPSAQGHLPFHGFSNSATKATIFPGLTNESLLSIGQFCDDNCIAIFTKQNVYIMKNEKILLQGKRNNTDGLWDIALPLESHFSSQANYIITKDKSKTDLARYLHATAFSPSLDTFQKAINNGNFLSWPGIRELNFKKLLGTTLALEKGHLDQERKNLQSTREHSKDFPPQKISNKTYNIFVTIATPNDSNNKTYSDQTGKFPHMSSRGAQYLFIMYDYDSNTILMQTLKNRQAKEISDAFKNAYRRLTKHGHEVSLFVLDNECSAELKSTISNLQVTLQLVPPHQHRRNAAERAIRTGKNHLLAGLATCDPDFPIAEWDRLIFQCELTLNLLRTSRVNPTLSAHAYINGNFDFNCTPLAPPGTKVVFHSKPTKRASWAFHGQEGWYIGPAIEHYRCLRIYNPQTHSEINSDTIKFIPRYIPIPEASIDDHIKRSLSDVLLLLLNRTPTLPVLDQPSARKALIDIAKVLERDSTPTIRPIVPSSPTTSIVHTTNIQPSSVQPTIPKESLPPKNVRWNDPITVPLVELPGDITTKGEDAPSPSNVLPSTSKGGDSSAKNNTGTDKDQDIDTLIRQFTSLKKKLQPTGKQKIRLPPPRIPPIKTPLPKQQKSLSRPRAQHPKATRQSTRRRVQRYSYDAPNRAWAAQFLAADKWAHKICHIYNEEGHTESIDSLLRGSSAATWKQSLSNELGRLAQGIGNLKGNDAMDFISIKEVPRDRKITYANMVCDYRPLKSDPYRVRLTVGGDRLQYDDDASSPAATLIETKLILNSTISDSAQGAR